MSSRLAAFGMLLLTVPAADAVAQDWRDVTSFRQRSSENRLDVHVRYGAGELVIRPGGSGELYRVSLRYDSDVFDPVTRYDSGYLEVGVEGRGKGIKVRNTEAGEMRLQLSPDVPLDMNLDFGAGEADVDLSGLRIANLDVETGASDTRIRFSHPNPVKCERIKVAMGAAAFAAEGLANSNCPDMTVEGGVGDLTLEFDGRWEQDIDAEITMALGSVTLVIPEDVGVRVDKDTFLTDFEPSGFSRSGDTFYSHNWESAAHHLNVRLKGAFGSATIRWAPPTGASAP